MNEHDTQNMLRLTASKLGWRLWRNNNGAGILQDGSFVRWGLANDSTAINQQLKSSDLIGIRPVMITADMVGRTIGQFVSFEVKQEHWKMRNTDRELAQQSWLDLVNELGGYAKFITNVKDLEK